MSKLPSNFKQIEVEGVRVGYIKHDLIGNTTLKRYEIAIEVNGEFRKITRLCEEVIFLDVVKELVFLEKLKSRNK